MLLSTFLCSYVLKKEIKKRRECIFNFLNGDLDHRVGIISHCVLLDIVTVYRYNVNRKKVPCYDDPRCIEG